MNLVEFVFWGKLAIGRSAPALRARISSAQPLSAACMLLLRMRPGLVWSCLVICGFLTICALSWFAFDLRQHYAFQPRRQSPSCPSGERGRAV